ncbi:trypsin-like serine peptidase [Pseudomonas fluorescens]|uniref:Peptidase S1 domain-containing protein n=1 Tax=Pseudomonas fluorescens TaxID=294 RepID=A0A5E7ACT9_PSEFL|nr:serine protease [Pseudomonas fluorescens]VVN76060.1 hypothetical protein PS723_00727 [Pseudomonas fluorescens]
MRHILATVIYYILSAALLSGPLHAEDLGEGLINQSPSMLLENHQGKYNHWNGIGQLFKDNQPICTASLIDTRDEENNALGPAYVLTAGHCVSLYLPRPGAVHPFEANVKFNFFNDTQHDYKSYTIQTANWASLMGTDIAILELTSSLSTLLEDGITPLELTRDAFTAPVDILIVGAPASLPESGLRVAACLQEPTAATLVENWWTYPDTLKNTCKDIRGGSSGSPVLDRKTGSIVGVLFTSTYGSTPDQLCFENTPCEVKNGKPEWVPETHYSHAIDYLPDCFVKGVFNSGLSSCTLEPGFKLSIGDYLPLRYTTVPSDDSQGAPTWGLSFSTDTPSYRFKSVRDARECSSAHYYSQVISSTEALIDTPTGREAGLYFLCVLGVESAEQTPTAGLLRNAWISPAQLVEAEPVRLPEPTITLGADWNYRVTWHFSYPLYAESYYYAGPADKTNCSDVKIEEYILVTQPVTFTAEQLPLTLCSYGTDYDSRPSAIRTDLLVLP